MASTVLFQKHQNALMSLKKKSKSLGALTALGSPNFGGIASPKMKKQSSAKPLDIRIVHPPHSPQPTHPVSNGGGVMNGGPLLMASTTPARSSAAVYRTTGTSVAMDAHAQQAYRVDKQLQAARSPQTKTTTPKVRYAFPGFFSRLLNGTCPTRPSISYCASTDNIYVSKSSILSLRCSSAVMA